MSEQRVEYVGFWARVGATLVDTFFLLLLTVPPLWAISSWTTSGFVNGTVKASDDSQTRQMDATLSLA